jgi:hypothetical protein
MGRARLVGRTLSCIRCGALRTDVINVRTFDRVSSSYQYPSGYQIKGQGSTAKNRNMFVRREVYERGW